MLTDPGRAIYGYDDYARLASDERVQAVHLWWSGSLAPGQGEHFAAHLREQVRFTGPDALNELVIAEGGRIYLAKDALTRRDHFRRMEPRLEEFQALRRRWDPELRLRSAQSVRVLGDPP